MNWQIDTAHTLVQFSVKHMMIAKVRGVFEEISGDIDLDLENPKNTSVQVELKADSINTRQSQRDEHLKSPDFLNAAEYPNLSFKSTKVEVLNKEQASMYGNLTIKDISKPVRLDVFYNGLSKSPYGFSSTGFTASGKINRKDWDLTWNQSLETGGVLVGEEIEISIEIELIKKAN